MRAKNPRYMQFKIDERATDEYLRQRSEYVMFEKIPRMERPRIWTSIEKSAYMEIMFRPMQKYKPVYLMPTYFYNRGGAVAQDGPVWTSWTREEYVSFVAACYVGVKWLIFDEIDDTYHIMRDHDKAMAEWLLKALFEMPAPSAVIGDNALKWASTCLMQAKGAQTGVSSDERAGKGLATFGWPVKAWDSLALFWARHSSDYKPYLENHPCEQWIGGFLDGRSYFDVKMPEWFQYKQYKAGDRVNYGYHVRSFFLPTNEVRSFLREQLDLVRLWRVLGYGLVIMLKEMGFYRGLDPFKDSGKFNLLKLGYWQNILPRKPAYWYSDAVIRSLAMVYVFQKTRLTTGCVVPYTGVWPKVGWSILTAVRFKFPSWQKSWQGMLYSYGYKGAGMHEVEQEISILRNKIFDLWCTPEDRALKQSGSVWFQQNRYNVSREGYGQRMSVATKYNNGVPVYSSVNRDNFAAFSALALAAIGPVLTQSKYGVDWKKIYSSPLSVVLLGMGTVNRNGIKVTGVHSFEQTSDYREVRKGGIVVRGRGQRWLESDIKEFVRWRSRVASYQ